jgi:hypothetical protein
MASNKIFDFSTDYLSQNNSFSKCNFATKRNIFLSRQIVTYQLSNNLFYYFVLNKFMRQSF